MNRSISLASLLILLVSVGGNAQALEQEHDEDLSSFLTRQVNGYFQPSDTTDPSPNLPDPKSVLYKSLFIPGWGQVVNNQIWKVPVVYALLGGLTGYSIYLTKKYHDYRAAYYNLNNETPDDFRFGPTPAYLQNANLSSLRDNRNFLRNRRDFVYVTILLAHGLNAIDAYVFAHLRSFDVSDDLSLRPTIQPRILARSTPGLTLSLELFKKSK